MDNLNYALWLYVETKGDDFDRHMQEHYISREG